MKYAMQFLFCCSFLQMTMIIRSEKPRKLKIWFCYATNMFFRIFRCFCFSRNTTNFFFLAQRFLHISFQQANMLLLGLNQLCPRWVGRHLCIDVISKIMITPVFVTVQVLLGQDIRRETLFIFQQSFCAGKVLFKVCLHSQSLQFPIQTFGCSCRGQDLNISGV